MTFSERGMKLSVISLRFLQGESPEVKGIDLATKERRLQILPLSRGLSDRVSEYEGPVRV